MTDPIYRQCQACMKGSDVDVAACVMDLLCRVSIVHSLLLEIETFCCHTYTNIIYATEHGHQTLKFLKANFTQQNSVLLLLRRS